MIQMFVFVLNGGMYMLSKDLYEICTDASYDYERKVSTYGMVVTKNNKPIKKMSKRTNILILTSIESEIFAIYQAMKFVDSEINTKKPKEIVIKTDCIEARNFFLHRKVNVFKNNADVKKLILNQYKKLCRIYYGNGNNFKIIWISRKINKDAHNIAYSKMLRARKKHIANCIVKKGNFIEYLIKFTKNQYEILNYFIISSDSENIVFTTQNELSNNFKISNGSISKCMRFLFYLNILDKVKNGKYQILL